MCRGISLGCKIEFFCLSIHDFSTFRFLLHVSRALWKIFLKYRFSLEQRFEVDVYHTSWHL